MKKEITMHGNGVERNANAEKWSYHCLVCW